MDCPACHQENLDGARFCAKCGALLPMPSTQGEDPLIGQIIGGRYRISQLLGEGGMGRVYLGEQQMGTNIRKVAVKTLQAQYAKDPQVLARFHRECGTVSELEHPNTIQFFDFGQTNDGQLYIAMEFVQGESLAAALQQGPMAPERVVRIMAQVCGSLEEAHGRGVVHRDLKPDNVILTVRAGQPDFVKVLDFGIAKRSEAKDQAQEQKLTQQGMVLGTPPYMSPEQFTGKELDARSDIYSLGVMAYEMLTGRLPFDADTPWQWATQHMTAQPFPFEMTASGPRIPPVMRGAILRALSKNREQRQTSVRQFYDELAGSAPVEAVSAAGGTAVMSAAPDWSALGPAAQVGSTVAVPVAYTPPGQPALGAPPGAAPGFAGPPPAGAQRGGSPKGLIWGLGGLAAVLAVAGVVVALRSTKPKDDVVITSPFGSAPVAANMPPAPEKPEPIPPPAEPASAEIPPPVQPAASPKSRPEPTPTPKAKEEPAKPASKGEPACLEARRLADNGDVRGAAAAFRNCEGPSAANAKTAIARKAPQAVQQKVFNGDCAGAKAVLAAAASVGASGGAESALGRCK